jgi:hypothetical protein
VSSAGSYLPEVAEAEAEGAVAELYEDIRGVLGLPLVNLVYRHLAVEPERLESAWRELRPNLTDAAVDAGARELLDLARLGSAAIPAAAFEAAGIQPSELPAVAATLDAYNHTNPRNLIALTALERGAPGVGGARPAATTAAPADLLPMADLSRLDPAVLALLHELAAPFAGRGETILIPGLLRHFAGRPPLLALFWTVLEPLARGRALARGGNIVARRAATLAGTLPHRVRAATDAETKAVLRQFTRTIPRMIVAGVVLRDALEAVLPRQG